MKLAEFVEILAEEIEENDLNGEATVTNIDISADEKIILKNGEEIIAELEADEVDAESTK